MRLLEIAASAWRPPRNDIFNTTCHREWSDAISSGVPSASLLVVRRAMRLLEIAASLAALPPRNDILNNSCRCERSDAIGRCVWNVRRAGCACARALRIPGEGVHDRGFVAAGGLGDGPGGDGLLGGLPHAGA